MSACKFDTKLFSRDILPAQSDGTSSSNPSHPLGEEVGTINPLNGVKVNTMSTAIRGIRDIAIALEEENQENFAAAVTALSKQPLIH